MSRRKRRRTNHERIALQTSSHRARCAQWL